MTYEIAGLENAGQKHDGQEFYEQPRRMKRRIESFMGYQLTYLQRETTLQQCEKTKRTAACNSRHKPSRPSCHGRF